MRFQSNSADLDLRTIRSVSYNVTMTQGSWTLIADEAALEWQDSANGEWQLKGKVRLRGPGSEIDADAAKVAIALNRIQSVNLHGLPATFRHYIEQQGKVAEGSAHSIEYDLNSSLVTLAGNAIPLHWVNTSWRTPLSFTTCFSKRSLQPIPSHQPAV